jgi:mRNA interferase RelE/StbE
MQKEFLMKNSGNKFYTIEYLETAKEDLSLLPKNIKKTIENAIYERLIDPIMFGKPLRYNLKEYHSLRVGDYRVIYKVEKKQQNVLIVAIKHRKYVYEEIH